LTAKPFVADDELSEAAFGDVVVVNPVCAMYLKHHD